MTVNAEALERVMTHIKDNPRMWRQATYFTDRDVHDCGTTACFAGWAVQFYAEQEGWKPREELFVATTARYYFKDGQPPEDASHVAEVAAEILGITDADADILFGGSNDMEQLETMVKNLLNNEEITTGVDLS